MAILLNNGNTIEIIDKTIIENIDIDKVNPQDVLEFCCQLKNIGVDLFEITPYIQKKFSPFINDFKDILGLDSFIIRLTSDNTSGKCNIISTLQKNINNTLEVDVDNLDNENNSIRNLKYIIENQYININKVRLLNLSKTLSNKWLNKLHEIREIIKIDICPYNNFYNANSIALEAIIGHLDCVTLSFAGQGIQHSYASLEEILVSVNLLINKNPNFDLSILQKSKKLFEKISHTKIKGNKPILGENIFKYESGIHADGISKNPLTYEPFNPKCVGLERKLVIGKHSGSKSIINKLIELGIKFKIDDINLNLFLSKIREKSIQIGRELFDDEIVKLYLNEGGGYCHE